MTRLELVALLDAAALQVEGASTAINSPEIAAFGPAAPTLVMLLNNRDFRIGHAIRELANDPEVIAKYISA